MSAVETQQAEEWLHSKVGPSAGTRWMNCPGSVNATKDMKDVSSQFAIEGTAAHTVTEWAREEGNRGEHYLGRMVPVWVNANRTDMIECDQEMVDAVNVFLDYTEQFHGEIFVEEMVHYERWVPGGFGTSDDMRVTETTCVITDFKYGKGIQVYAEDNTQMKFYALGFWHDYGWMYPDLSKFQLNICQPRLEHIDEWTITVADLLIWAEEKVRPAGKLALGENAPFKAGDHCQWCLKKRNCSVRDKMVFEDILDDFENLDAGLEVTVTDTNDLTLEQVALRLPLISMIKKYCTDLEIRALSEVGKGNVISNPITGDYKIVEGRGSRRWINNEELTIETLRKTHKLKVGEIFNSKLKSPPQIETLVGKKHPIMSEMVEKIAGKPTLVPGTDKRVPITIDPETEFDDCSDE